MRQVFPFHQFHDQRSGAAGFLETVNVRDVGMIELTRSAMVDANLSVRDPTYSNFHRSRRRSKRPMRDPTTNTHAATTIAANTPVVSNTPSAWAIR